MLTVGYVLILDVQYNGCAWKGGRLRLEKAKEHYLASLKREWEEDVELPNSTGSDCADADKDMVTSGKPKKVQDLDKKLKIFFPGLSKVSIGLLYSE